MKRAGKIKCVDCYLILFMVFVILVTLYPFLNILAISLNDGSDTIKGGINLFPRRFTWSNYQFLFGHNNLFQAFLVSVARTVVGTISGLLGSTMLAYTLSRKDYIFRKPITILLVITLYVSGGVVPDYMLIKNLHLINRFAVYIVPNVIAAFNVIMLKAYMESLPYSFQESAKLDGANDFVIFYKIVIPLCKPVLATIGLFIAVSQWNAWFDTYLYASGNRNLSTLQYEMMKILNDTAVIQSKARQVAQSGNYYASENLTPEAIRMAITVVATAPILVIYPFLQKYFIKGMTLGGIKN